MSVLSLINEGIDALVEKYVEHRAGRTIPPRKDTLGPRLKLVRESRKQVSLVAGELGRKVYGEPMANALEERLSAKRNYSVRILFHKAPDLRKAAKMFRSANPGLLRLLGNPEYKDRIEMYWARRRPLYHFVVADDNVLIEALHKPRAPRETYLKQGDSRLATRYRKYFDQMAHNPKVVAPFYPTAKAN